MTDDPPPAPRLLVTGPAGSGKTHHALERIRAAATVEGERGRGAADPDAALLLVPTYAHALHVKRVALSRFGARGIFDAPFTTFTAAGERFLPDFRVRSIPSADERDRLMEEALRRADVELFRRVADRVGFRAHLLRLVKEVKQSGLAPADALARLAVGQAELDEVAADRLDGFRSVFTEYESLLARAELADHEDRLRELLEAMQRGELRSVPRTLVVDGFDDFTPVEERILYELTDAVAKAGGEVLITLPHDPARPELFPGSAETRDRWRARGFEERSLTGFPRSTQPGVVAIAQRLFGPPGKPAPASAGVAMLVAGDAEDEAEQVAREVRRLVEAARDGADGALPIRGWRGVGVVLRRVDDAAARFESAFARMGVPLRVMGGGRRLGSEPLVRALRGPLALLAGRTAAGQFDARSLTAWMRWRAACDGDDAERTAVDAWEIGHRQDGFPPSWAAYMTQVPPALEPFVHELTAAQAELEAVGTGTETYTALAQALQILTPLPASAGVDDEGIPIDAEGDERIRRATAAVLRLLGILEALERAVVRTHLGSDVRPAQAIDELLDAVERSRMLLPDHRLDAVTLMDAEEARYWELDVVVVAGLEAGAFPLHPREDVLLRDADRSRLAEGPAGLRLPLAREREAREHRLFYGAVTRARHQVILARSAYDEDGDPKGASFFLRDVERVLVPEAIGAVPRPGRAAVALARCVSAGDLRRFAAASVASRGVDEPTRRIARALLDVTASAAEHRAEHAVRPRSDDLRDASGELPAWVRTRIDRRTGLVSVSALNRAIRCPHQLFLSDMAGVPEDDVPFDGPVFDVRAEGRALHRALELALREPDAPAADLADTVVGDLSLDEVESRLLRLELVRIVELFRARESATAGSLVPAPDALELKFGFDGSVVLGTAPDAFGLRGFIDRIDVADGTASIIDYKSSRTGCESAQKRALDLQDLQLPLYARALSALRRIDVRGVEWVAIRTRDRRIVHDASDASAFAPRREGVKPKALDRPTFDAWIDEAVDVAQSAIALARAGAHPKAPADKDACTHCAWFDVCRPDRGDPEPLPGDGGDA